MSCTVCGQNKECISGHFAFVRLLIRSVVVLTCVHGAQSVLDGYWTNSSNVKCKHKSLAGRAPGIGADARPNDWLSQSCPLEATDYSCYFVGDVERAHSLEETVWVSSSGECLDFDPLNFLQLIQGRRLFYYGDSTMGQMYVSLVCTLLATSKDLNLKYQWVEWDMTESDKEVCIYGFEHCHLQLIDPFDIIAESLSLDFALFHKASHNRRDKFFETLRVMRFEASDVMIFNFGLWNNDESVYVNLLTSIIDELKFIKMNRSLTLPALFFLESTPQHFSTFQGYYDESSDKTLPCRPLADIYQAKQMDWRNIHANSIFGGHEENLGLRIIPIAEALYERWDAHLQNTTRYVKNDCTHWCSPSGVFNYIHERIYEAIADATLPAAPAIGSLERENNIVRNHFEANKQLLSHLHQYEQLVEVEELQMRSLRSQYKKRLDSLQIAVPKMQLVGDKSREKASDFLKTSRLGLPFLSAALLVEGKMMLQSETSSDVYALKMGDKALIPTHDVFQRLGGNGAVPVEIVPSCQLDLINERVFRAADFNIADSVEWAKASQARPYGPKEREDRGEDAHEETTKESKSPRVQNSLFGLYLSSRG